LSPSDFNVVEETQDAMFAAAGTAEEDNFFNLEKRRETTEVVTPIQKKRVSILTNPA
jgi:hypothetical protein